MRLIDWVVSLGDIDPMKMIGWVRQGEFDRVPSCQRKRLFYHACVTQGAKLESLYTRRLKDK